MSSNAAMGKRSSNPFMVRNSFRGMAKLQEINTPAPSGLCGASVSSESAVPIRWVEPSNARHSSIGVLLITLR